ncbi:hypothetical protein K458DRAFT_358667 [Lentithecium fluviatile CBS 122367]|uniref:BTB domain-containing protein n=1 Tax=Lentithecium fluviatile CBS 122367 TaxID=1168545 RepID=A0A6G1JHS5_9PLEO|nr:hypothetical protein K458DRAFT_358667 [Lentithecium fluviatile CBS 122367]
MSADGSTSNGHPSIVLHDFGNVTLLLGAEDIQQPVLASTAILRLAGPVWKAMFERHWAESEASEIAFPDDDVDAMLLVLRIAHLRFNEIPAKNGLSFEALLDLSVVCDKYDIVSIVRPFLDLHCWAEPYMVMAGSFRTVRPEWLLVSWTFGYSDSFDILARRVAFTSTRSSGCNAHPECEDGKIIQDEMLPPGILGKSYSPSVIYSQITLYQRQPFGRLTPELA